ncbi:MAG: hypothetical protein ACFB0E_15715 [Leptolyngbyaceae cyanobacterium]
MWQLTAPAIRGAILDFSALGQSHTAVTQLVDGDLTLVNAIELLDWERAEQQLMTCEVCGITGCAPGNWVQVKRSESLALITPAFSLLSEAPQHLAREYVPPHYLLEKGVIFIERVQYSDIFHRLADFPGFATLAPLMSQEIGKIYQLEAPFQVLDDWQAPPKLLPDIVIASSEGSHLEQIQHLTDLLEQLLCENRPVNLRPTVQADQVINFYLDVAGVPRWPVLSYDGTHYSLYLEPGYIIT